MFSLSYVQLTRENYRVFLVNSYEIWTRRVACEVRKGYFAFGMFTHRRQLSKFRRDSPYFYQDIYLSGADPGILKGGQQKFSSKRDTWSAICTKSSPNGGTLHGSANDCCLSNQTFHFVGLQHVLEKVH